MTVSFFWSVYFMNGRVEVSCKITQFLWQLEGTSTQNRRSVATQMSGKVMAGAPFTSHSGLSHRNRCVCVCLCHTETGVSMFVFVIQKQVCQCLSVSHRNRYVCVCLYHTETGVSLSVSHRNRCVCLSVSHRNRCICVCLLFASATLLLFVSVV